MLANLKKIFKKLFFNDEISVFIYYFTYLFIYFLVYLFNNLEVFAYTKSEILIEIR